jgi:hypothetical protein
MNGLIRRQYLGRDIYTTWLGGVHRKRGLAGIKLVLFSGFLSFVSFKTLDFFLERRRLLRYVQFYSMGIIPGFPS